MNKSIAYAKMLPCGYELWVIPRDDGTHNLRVFYGPEEMKLDELNFRLRKEDLLAIADKIREIYQPTKEK